MSDFKVARELIACAFTGFMLALQNADLPEPVIAKIIKDATLLTKTIISDSDIPIGPKN